MAATQPSYPATMILEEKIKDLESKLSHTCQTLKAKEHVLHLQQEQMKKLEEMYKKSLNEMANVTCEHKKTLNDLENLRIILRSYENRHISQENFECQVDILPILPPPPAFADNLEKDDRFSKINEFLESQNSKTDKIMQLLQSSSSHKTETLEQYIEELQMITQNLTEITDQRSHPITSTKSILFPILEESEKVHSAKYKLVNFDAHEDKMCLLTECSSQTLNITSDCSFNTNIPEETISKMIQTVFHTKDSWVSTERNTSDKEINCEMTNSSSSVSVLIQNTIYDDIDNIKMSLNNLEMQEDTREKLYEHCQEAISQCQTLIGYVDERDEELKDLRNKISCLKSIIERNSLLTTKEVKELCKEITVKTVENYSEVLQEIKTLREENEMLKTENKDLKMDNSEVPRIVIELSSRYSQTYLVSNVNEEIKLDKEKGLAKHLEEALSDIKYLEDKVKYLENNNTALEELKHICLVTNPGSVQSQLEQLKVMYEEKIRLLENELVVQNNKQEEMITVSTQIYGWASLNEQLEQLRLENEDLLKTIHHLKQELNIEKINRNAMDELRVMCLKLGQNLNETTAVKKENSKLQEQLKEVNGQVKDNRDEWENILKKYLEDINDSREEINNLRQENKQLSEGIDELKLVVLLNTQLEQNGMPEATVTCSEDSSESIEHKPQIHKIDLDQNLSPEMKTEKVQAAENSCSSCEIDKLTIKCKDLTERIKLKKVNSQIDYKFDLLTMLESDLNVLSTEFDSFKKVSMEDSQKFLREITELNNKNKQLVSCINQYKTVNESLLQSHYELEQARNIAALEHQNLIEQYLKVQEKLSNFETSKTPAIDSCIMTIAIGQDFQDLDLIKAENNKLQKQNTKLKQEIENLITQINDQHMTCLQNLKQNVANKICNTCETTMKTLETLNENFKQLNDENVGLKKLLSEKEIQLNDMVKRYKALTKDILDYNKIKEELNNTKQVLIECEESNDHLRHEISSLHDKVESVKFERNAVKDALEVLQVKSSKEATDLKNKINDKDHAIDKHQDEINMLQSAIAKIGSIKEKYMKLEVEYQCLKAELTKKDNMIKWNESRINKLNYVEDNLKMMTTNKEKIEMDFESYIRTNNLLQQTMTTHNDTLLEEMKQIKADNDILKQEFQDLQGLYTSLQEENRRVSDQCKYYKVQLDNMAEGIDQHLKDHQIYKTEVEEVKKKLYQEISTLKQMLDMQHMRLEAFDMNKFDGSDAKKQTYDLNMFINAKELEIDYLMEQKMQAMETMNKLIYDINDKSRKGEISGRSKRLVDEANANKEEFKVKINLKKAAASTRDIGCNERLGNNGRQHFSQVTSEPRSASLPRPSKMSKYKSSWDKEKRPNEPSTSRSFHCRKPILNVQVKKKI